LKILSVNLTMPVLKHSSDDFIASSMCILRIIRGGMTRAVVTYRSNRQGYRGAVGLKFRPTGTTADALRVMRGSLGS
jgi:hypothetical protein